MHTREHFYSKEYLIHALDSETILLFSIHTDGQSEG